MRVLLCDKKTGMYFRKPADWTTEPDQADDFGNSLKAFYFAQENSLADVEVYLDFGDPEYNVHLPVVHSANPPPTVA